LVGTFNLLDCITKSSGFLDYILYVGIFIILAFITWICQRYKKYKWNAIFYAVIGLGTILGNEIGNYSGAVFIIFSIYIYHSLKTDIILSFMILIIAVAKNMFFDFGIEATINLILVYSMIFTIYYILIHPKSKQSKIVYCPHLDETDIQIVQNLYQSCIYKEIAPLVDLKEGAVARRVSRLRQRMNVGSTQELIVKCLQMGYILPNVDKASL